MGSVFPTTTLQPHLSEIKNNISKKIWIFELEKHQINGQPLKTSGTKDSTQNSKKDAITSTPWTMTKSKRNPKKGTPAINPTNPRNIRNNSTSKAPFDPSSLSARTSNHL